MTCVVPYMVYALIYSGSVSGRRQATAGTLRMLKRPEQFVEGGTIANAGNSKVRVAAYWMRHGLSCANIWGMFVSDPSLTGCAVERASMFGPSIWGKVLAAHSPAVPLVFTSPLLRAMETAMHNFKNVLPADSLIYPIPYIGEENRIPYFGNPGFDTPDNFPEPWVDQERRLRNHTQSHPNPEGLIDRITFKDNINPSDHVNRTTSRKASYRKFLQKFPWMLSQILAENGIGPDSPTLLSQEIPVIIVSHGGFMQHNLQMGQKLGRKPVNNEVWMERYEIDSLPRVQDASDWILADHVAESDQEQDLDETLAPEANKAKATREQKNMHSMRPVKDSGGSFEDIEFAPPPKLMCTESVSRCPEGQRPQGVECESSVSLIRACGGSLAEPYASTKVAEQSSGTGADVAALISEPSISDA